MNTPSPLAAAFTQPVPGVQALVDALLAASFSHNLDLCWHADRLRVRSPGGEWQEVSELPRRKSIFRAVLARVAVLCNERQPGSASPYGGEGEIAPRDQPDAVFRVAFINTPSEQRLEWSRVRLGAT